MTSTLKILGIAPYEELNNSMQIVSKEFKDIQIDIFTANLDEGQQLTRELIDNNYDAIISRGGTAELIRQSVSIPVIDVSISIYDILGAIRLAYSYMENIAIVAYPSITETAHLLCDILDYKIKIITLNDSLDIDNVLDQLISEQYEMILCDVITNRFALSKSLNTILITSGIESIRHAFKDALTLSTYLKKFKHEHKVLELAFKSQSHDYIIFDNHFDIVTSNIVPALQVSLQSFLKSKKLIRDVDQYFHTINNSVYSIQINQIRVDESIYYSCDIKNSTPPLVNNRFGVTYQKRNEVEDYFDTSHLLAKFIPDDIIQELIKINNSYKALIIMGETGTTKTSIAYRSYLNFINHNKNLITVNSKLMNDKLWKFLVNPSNGPLVDNDNTILFQNVEQLSLDDTEQLITIVKNSKFLNRNNLIFTYNKSTTNDTTIYNRLMTELQCASIYAPSLKERKNELNIITTLLLNRINIEHNKEVVGFVPNAMNEFLEFDWPGNFNQLQLVLKDLVINSTTHYISEHQVSQALNKERVLNNFTDNNLGTFSFNHSVKNPTLFDYTKEIILQVLDQNDGNQTLTAEQLGISRTTLWRYLKKD